MHRAIRGFLVPFFLCPLLLSVNGTANAAAEGSMTVAGTGTLSPGLPATGCVDLDVSFSGTAVGAGGLTGVYSVAFNGASTVCETLSSGQGAGVLSGDLHGNLTYQRTGNVITLSGSIEPSARSDESKDLIVAACVVAATAINPVAGFAMFCVWVLSD
jgi:hypothetical protein